MAHVCRRLLAPPHRTRHVAAEPRLSERRSAARGQLPVEPGRAVAAYLCLKIERRKGADGKPVAALAQVVSYPTRADVGGDPPCIRVEPLDMPGSAHRL